MSFDLYPKVNNIIQHLPRAIRIDSKKNALFLYDVQGILILPFVYLIFKSNVSSKKKAWKTYPTSTNPYFFLVVIQKSCDNNMEDQEIRNRRQGLRSNRGNIKKSIIINILILCNQRWVTPIITLGNARALQKKDLYKVAPEDESEKLGLELER